MLKFIAKRWRRLARRLRPHLYCNICKGSAFVAGPQGRMSATGKPPRCAKCRSMERHRALRKIFLRIGVDEFRSWRCLQFSKDPTVSPRWFRQHERSMFGRVNSLDLQAIDRPDASYDMIVCNHVLEHVADYRAALRELGRVLNGRGFMLLSFPDPQNLETTVDWGRPNPEEFSHYRRFGRDVEPVMAKLLPDCHILPLVERDDVTGTTELAYIVTRDPRWLERVKR